ncbi:universal stress protein [Actinoplanes sp. NPDC024001]|uniref:universal stress protein n=1 Tax=unclassified Actinoplanes TaxID=2626549 RepID=UPI002E20E474
MRSVRPADSKPPVVVVGVGDMLDALNAVDVAAMEAAYRDVPLVVVHAWPSGQGESARYRTPDSSQGRHLLGLAVCRAQAAAPGLQVTTEWVNDSPTQALVQRSTSASLLVMGHHDTVGPHDGWGSTTARLAHCSSCPVLVYRGQASSQGPVVAAVHSDQTAVLARAYEIAARGGRHLVVVQMDTETSTGAALAGDRIGEVINAWRSTRARVLVDRLLVSDVDIAHAMQRASWRGRLLVAGIDHDSPLTRAVSGSAGVAQVSHQLCPVLLVPTNWHAA